MEAGLSVVQEGRDDVGQEAAVERNVGLRDRGVGGNRGGRRGDRGRGGVACSLGRYNLRDSTLRQRRDM